VKGNILDRYHICDARKISDFLPNKEFVSLTITSPPYWNLKHYGPKKQLGYGQTYENYLEDLEGIFEGVYRVTKKSGSLWLVVNTIKDNGEMKLFPFDLAERLKRVGWVLQDIIIWHKDKTLPWSHKGKLRNIFEYILFFTKGRHFKYRLERIREVDQLRGWWVRYPERYSPAGKAPSEAWTIPIPRQGSWGDKYNWVRHFCPFPPALVNRILLLTTDKGDVVMDPFSGSGVVLAQAKVLGRRYLGLDVSQKYKRMFERRVLPSLASRGMNGSKERKTTEKKKKLFASLIWRLRKTKYPRELLRLYRINFGKQNIAGVLLLSKGTTSARIVVLFMNSVPKYFLTRARQLMAHPPLSKYGLRIAISAAPLDKLKNLVPRKNGSVTGRKLILYEKGRTYQCSAYVPIEKLPGLFRSVANGNGVSIPPIVSNIRVKILSSKGF